MIIGFTGSRNGMSPKQRVVFEHEIKTAIRIGAIIDEFHHGDCIGSDLQAHNIINNLIAVNKIVVHPPKDGRYRAYVDINPPRIVAANSGEKDYLDRNRDIVMASDVLIACPEQMEEPINIRGSGTWMTIKYARTHNKSVVIIYPDGTVERFGE